MEGLVLDLALSVRFEFLDDLDDVFDLLAVEDKDGSADAEKWEILASREAL